MFKLTEEQKEMIAVAVATRDVFSYDDLNILETRTLGDHEAMYATVDRYISDCHFKRVHG